MALKRYDPDEAEFDARYQRWLAALESGDEAELLEATAAIPTLNSQILDRFFAVEGDDLERPGQRAMEQRHNHTNCNACSWVQFNFLH